MTDICALQLQNFSFAYPKEGFCLSNLTWKVTEGSFTLLLGKTGSGKTTLLRCFAPALTPHGNKTGSIELYGRLPEAYSLREGCSLVGYVSQNSEASIVCHSVLAELAFGLENLGVGPANMAKRIAEIVAFFGMESWIHQETATLSGGQRQQLALAAALVMRPKLLLLDEPLAQLDPVAQKTFAALLQRVNRELGVTLVVATHDPYTLASYATEAVALGSQGLENMPLGEFALKPWDPPSKPTSSRTGISQTEKAFEANEAWFRYDKVSPWVLQGVQSSCSSGECIALLGSNGAGKTTYLQLIAQLLKPTIGTVRNGCSACQAYLPQNPAMLLVCDSVSEELQEWQNGAGYSNEAIDEMLDTLQLQDKLSVHPLDLSGGEQQKLALGKLLLTQPKLLILDEPTKGLDWTAKVQITHLLFEAQRSGTTIVMATHDLACAAAVADRIWLLFDGEIISSEKPQDFFRDTVFYRLYEDPYTKALDSLEW